MELELIDHSYADNSKLKSINKGIIYHVFSGRNAWHSQWVTTYTNKCMHTTFESAKKHAESNRIAGSVFYISQLPCIVLRSEQSTILITEINSENPLSNHSYNLKNNYVQFILDNLDSELLIKNENKEIQSTIDLFKTNSKHWQNTKRHQSIIILKQKAHIPIETLKTDNLSIRVSKSFGAGYYLIWRSIDSNIKAEAVNKIRSVIKSIWKTKTSLPKSASISNDKKIEHVLKEIYELINYFTLTHSLSCDIISKLPIEAMLNIKIILSNAKDLITKKRVHLVGIMPELMDTLLSKITTLKTPQSIEFWSKLIIYTATTQDDIQNLKSLIKHLSFMDENQIITLSNICTKT